MLGMPFRVEEEESLEEEGEEEEGGKCLSLVSPSLNQKFVFPFPLRIRNLPSMPQRFSD